ncbi:TetR/AcrR family transcriptional regulator [Schleiferilactobacillus harbinensis]|jgi:AcrR family transcriptional regulator|uniref:TetR/AcrR family transcriptional regulator n=1 Tax=Schleiferilactobacillus harbinensis TaxID=304207 RepID=UPI0007BA0073|nr:TetR/AcrR family transcriptional regulator [Schleiferilactobacillus harbinensis]MCI1851083.1 TetR/AcrR family transcriptional regulator [Schleiferilactobacillus harbinensis]
MDKVTNTKGDAILEAALHLFATQGYAETNVPSIAKAAQVGVGTVYRYFKNKDSILNHLFQKVLAVFLSEIQEAVDEHADIQAQFSQLFDASAGLMLNYTPELQFMNLNVFNEVLDDDSRAARAKVITYYTDFLQHGQDAHIFVHSSPDVQLVLLYGSVQTMVSFLWAKHRFAKIPPADTRNIQQLKNQLWNALTVERKIFVEEV